MNGTGGTNVTVPTSGNVTRVAAYGGIDGDPPGRPTVLAFDNDVSCVDAGDGRLAARHVATAPAVDVLVDGSEVVGDLVFGESAELTVTAGSYEVEIQLASDGTTVPGPTGVDVIEGESLLLYAVGDPQADAPLALLSQVLELDTCPPETTTTTTTVPTPDPVTPATPARPVPATPTFTG